MLYLDTDNALELILPNDMFFYIKDGEEPLFDIDEKALDEFYNNFENGFEVCDYEALEDGNIKAIFVPYVADDFEFNYVYPKHTDLQMQVCIQNKSIGEPVSYRMYYKFDGSTISKGESVIEQNDKRNMYFRTEHGSIYWLKTLCAIQNS